METITIPAELLNRIRKEIESEPQPEVYWHYDDKLSDEQISLIIRDPEGLSEVTNELWEMNTDHIYNLEVEHVRDIIKTDRSAVFTRL